MIYTSDGSNIHQYSKSYRAQRFSNTWGLTCILLPPGGWCVRNLEILKGSFAVCLEIVIVFLISCRYGKSELLSLDASYLVC